MSVTSSRATVVGTHPMAITSPKTNITEAWMVDGAASEVGGHISE